MKFLTYPHLCTILNKVYSKRKYNPEFNTGKGFANLASGRGFLHSYLFLDVGTQIID